MTKSKTTLIALAVALAAMLSAPSAQGSELAKLGRLIVTGKRAPAPEAKPALPALSRETEPRPHKGESGSAGARAVEAGGEVTLDDAGASEPAPVSPRQGVPSDRVGRAALTVAVG